MNFASKSGIYEIHWDLLHAAKLGHIIYYPSEGRHTEYFPDARKIQRLRPGLNPRTRVPVASMLTTRPPNPSTLAVTLSTNSFTVHITVRNISDFSVLFPYSKQCVVPSKLVTFTLNPNIHENIKWLARTINCFPKFQNYHSYISM
jgi:hypothetical protein